MCLSSVFFFFSSSQFGELLSLLVGEIPTKFYHELEHSPMREIPDIPIGKHYGSLDLPSALPNFLTSY